MGQKHIILRSAAPTATASPGARSGAPSGVTFAPAPAVSVEVDELRPSRAVEVARSRDVVAVAPVVPMKLIAPVPLNVPAEPLAGRRRRGAFKAVGADTSPFTGRGVVVAVLDTGIDPTHPAFAGVELERRNFTDARRRRPARARHALRRHDLRPRGERHADRRRAWREQALIGKVLGGNGGGERRDRRRRSSGPSPAAPTSSRCRSASTSRVS